MRCAELKQLETDLLRAQAGNVVQGGSDLFSAGRAESGVGQSPQQQAARYDEDTAGRQWDKLQQAQEVTLAKVLPLRVNLPTHGVRYVFTQVLQTEVKAPMKVSFHVVNSRATSWPAQIGLGATGFAGLWLLVAAMFTRRHS
jgi:hypothetical protein